MNFCDNWCPPYSNDQSCRCCPGFNNELRNIDEFLANYKSDSETVTSDDNCDTVITDEHSENQEQSSKSKNDENTCVSLESSRW